MKKTKKGFTLVELLVVIAILAILATVSVVGYTSFIQKAKDSNAATELHQVVTYIEAELLTENSFEITVANTAKYVVAKDENTLTVTKYEYYTTEGKFKTEAKNASANDNFFNEALNAISDFEALDGTFTINGWNITFTATEGGTATETISLR